MMETMMWIMNTAHLYSNQHFDATTKIINGTHSYQFNDEAVRSYNLVNKNKLGI